jgi:hypothetical protein
LIHPTISKEQCKAVPLLFREGCSPTDFEERM